jgi:hypothetical protein
MKRLWNMGMTRCKRERERKDKNNLVKIREAAGRSRNNEGR